MKMDDSWESLKQTVQQQFAVIREAVGMREKLLLRQIDVIATSQKQPMGRGANRVTKTTHTKSVDGKLNAADSDAVDVKVKFLANQEEELLATIRSFGRFQLDNINFALQDIYLKNEDYITPINDHETMYKCLQTGETTISIEDEAQETPEAIVVDFSKNKSLIEHNRKHMNKSIINITLQEAKDLIRRAKMKRETPSLPLNLEELDDELESSIAEAVSCLSVGSGNGVNDCNESTAHTKSSQTCIANDNDKKNKKSRFKPKITINNCNGTINLRNISSLTINCATEDAISAELPVKDEEFDFGEDEQTPTMLHPHGKHEQKCKTTPNSTYSSSTQQITPTKMEITTSTGNTTPTTTASSSNYSSNASSRSQSKKQKKNKKSQNKKQTQQATSTDSKTQEAATTSTNNAPYVYEDEDDDDTQNVATCDFYNRLLNEIKNSLKEEKCKRAHVDNSQYLISSSNTAQSVNADSTSDGNSNICYTTTGVSASTLQGNKNKRLVLKNFENLRIILEANGEDDALHPVQIEQWLAEIISETDLEPMQNKDILEHSKIHCEEK